MWKDITFNEMKAFVEILLLIGLTMLIIWFILVHWWFYWGERLQIHHGKRDFLVSCPFSIFWTTQKQKWKITQSMMGHIRSRCFLFFLKTCATLAEILLSWKQTKWMKAWLFDSFQRKNRPTDLHVSKTNQMKLETLRTGWCENQLHVQLAAMLGLRNSPGTKGS